MTDFTTKCDTLIQELLCKPILEYSVPLLEPTLNSKEEGIAKNIIKEFLDSDQTYVAYGSSYFGTTEHHLYRYTSGERFTSELFTIYSSTNVPYQAVRGSRYI
jgi:hypothetical protein